MNKIYAKIEKGNMTFLNTESLKMHLKEFEGHTEICEDCGELYQSNTLTSKKCINCIVKHQEKQWNKISKKYNGAVIKN